LKQNFIKRRSMVSIHAIEIIIIFFIFRKSWLKI
jgi:hypothetical protein